MIERVFQYSRNKINVSNANSETGEARGWNKEVRNRTRPRTLSPVHLHYTPLHRLASILEVQPIGACRKVLSQFD